MYDRTHLYSKEITHHSLILHMIGEVCLEKVRIGHQHLDNSFGKPLHIAIPDGGVLALQLLKHFKALGQLGEDVDNRTGEIGVFCVLPELGAEERVKLRKLSVRQSIAELTPSFLSLA